MDTKNSILIVDDDPKFRKTLCDILKTRGWSIEVVSTGPRGALESRERVL